jgi:CheY-like chemotaxis protein
MDGYAVARAPRRGSVAVSGHALPEDVARAAEAGFDEHVAKPPDPAVLERALAAPDAPHAPDDRRAAAAAGA